MRTAFLSAAVFVAAAACSSGDDSQPSSTTATDTRPSTTPAAAAQTAIATAEAWDSTNGPVWAAQVCAISQALAESVASVDDHVDATTLPVQARKDRAARQGAVVSAAFDHAASKSAEVTPPSGVGAFHETLAGAYRDILDAYNVSLAEVAQANTAEEIGAANAKFNAVYDQLNKNIAAGLRALPPEALAALRRVNKCGALLQI